VSLQRRAAHADGDVDGLAHRIDAPVGGCQVQRDVGMHGHEFGQHDADVRLQQRDRAGDAAAEPRFRHAQRAACLRKTAMVRNLDVVVEVVQILHGEGGNIVPETGQ
jgi:hypothetical protein